MHKLAIVVATKDRPQELERLLSGIRDQSFRPQQMIVADGSDHPVQPVVQQFPELEIDYLTVRPPALTKQKNAGLALVRSEISLVGFIDDDIVFEEGSIAAMVSFWEGAEDSLGGACFNLTTSDPPDGWLRSALKQAFFIDNRQYGQVHRSGFNTSIWNTQENRMVRWLGGGYTIWRKNVFDELRFDEWFAGSGLWEDVRFSYRAGKCYQLVVVAEAKVAHLEGPISRKGQVLLGKTQIVNWVYFVKSSPGLSLPMCLWACVGRIVVNLVKGATSLDPNPILRAVGNTLGLAVVATRAVGSMSSWLARFKSGSPVGSR